MGTWIIHDFYGRITPKGSGVYVIYLFNYYKVFQGENPRYKLIYVGSTKNLSARIDPDGKAMNDILRCDGLRYSKMIKYKETCSCLELEKKLIKKLHPILNKTHNRPRRF